MPTQLTVFTKLGVLSKLPILVHFSYFYPHYTHYPYLLDLVMSVACILCLPSFIRVQEREAILKLHAGALPLADDVALPELATACHGYSGADLAALCREAAMAALSDAAAAMLAGKPFTLSPLSRENQVFF